MKVVQQCVNKKRRTHLTEAHSLLGRAAFIVERARDEEQDGFDNLPEGLQSSERGEAMEETVDELQLAIDSINEAMEHVDCARSE